MIALPPSFNVGQFFTEIFSIAAPFASIGFMIGCGFLIIKILKRA